VRGQFAKVMLGTGVLALVLALCACTPQTASISSEWPVATSEATVTAPPGMLRSLLTGRSLSAAAIEATAPVCVKVTDAGAPLAGVGAADVVYETGDAAQGTLLSCIYGGEVPRQVSPLAQAAMPDLWIVPQYHALLFSAGVSPDLAAQMNGWVPGENASFGAGEPFDDAYGGRGRSLSGSSAMALSAQYGSGITSAAPAYLEFSASTGTTNTPISTVSVPFVGSWTVSWTYNARTHTYLRSINGKPQSDVSTHARLSASNVVVLWVRYSALDADLSGQGGFDVTLGGQGQASVFRGGQRLDGRWKADGTSPPRFVTEDGQAIRLAPGNTWFEAIPLSTDITLK
jgi:hypothetical protein